MKEIKFKFFDKEAKKIFPVYTIELENKVIHWKFNDTWKRSDDFTLLVQYTGLKDKNGTEIYEGDILDTGQGILYKVEYIRDRFVLMFLKEEYEISLSSYFNTSTIVGNIFQNPELRIK